MIALNARALTETVDPEAPHQLRVGLRRLRSTLWAARPFMSREGRRNLSNRARDLARIVGGARDVDVLRFETLPTLKDSAAVALETVDHGSSAAQAFAALEVRLEKEASARRAAAREPAQLLDAATLALDVLTLAGDAERADKPKSVKRDARRWSRGALERAAKRVYSHGPKLSAMSVEDRHALRKDCKRLRYAIAGFAPLYDERVMHPTLRALKKLQNALGSLNDAANVIALRSIAPESRFQPVVEAIITAAEVRAEADLARADKRWSAFLEAPRYWR